MRSHSIDSLCTFQDNTLTACAGVALKSVDWVPSTFSWGKAGNRRTRGWLAVEGRRDLLCDHLVHVVGAEDQLAPAHSLLLFVVFALAGLLLLELQRLVVRVDFY